MTYQVRTGTEARHLRDLDRLNWAIVAAVAAVVVLAAAGSTFRIAWATFLAPAGATAALLAGAWYYARHRIDPALASALNGTAQMIAFAAVAAPLSYLAASLDLPLQDAAFDAADRAWGFTWLCQLNWMNAHPWLHTIFAVAYLSFAFQASATILALAFTRRLADLRVFMLAFFLTALVTIAVSGLLPAQGVWGHYGLTAGDYPGIVPVTRELHLTVFSGLRDGGFRLLTGANSEGIITFPSLHAALGLIFIAALWPVPVLRWAGVAVNALMIVATPVDGGHYVVDVVAGIAIAAACWLAAQAAVRRLAQTGKAAAAYPAVA
jgi:membrane-associated phospholipid phosphatase